MLDSCATGGSGSRPGPTVEISAPIQEIPVKKSDTIALLAKHWEMTGPQFRQVNDLKPDQDLSGRKTVRVYQKSIEGLKKQEFMKVVRRNGKQIKRCYEELVKRVPSSSGIMIVSLEIDRSGVVNSVTYSNSTLGDPAIEACVAKEVSSWKFGDSEAFDTVTVDYPFIFKIIPKEK
jgi:hypothetical protein